MGGKTLFYPYFGTFIPPYNAYRHYNPIQKKKAYTLTSVSLSKLKQPIKEIDCLLYQIIVCSFVLYLSIYFAVYYLMKSNSRYLGKVHTSSSTLASSLSM